MQRLSGSRAKVDALRVQRAAKEVARQAARKRTLQGEPKLAKKPTQKPTPPPPLTHLPARGIWALDQVKSVSRLEDLHVISIDPGKRELIVATDADDPHSKPYRYTQRQRLKDMRSRQYTDLETRNQPLMVRATPEELSNHNSRSAHLSTFSKYITQRRESLAECLEYYGGLEHRERHWKRAIKLQKSEQKMFDSLRAMKTDHRPLALAYGSWGLVAGQVGACNKGNPPCIGVGLMRKLAKHFLVVPTPEQYTSKTCHKCMHECAAHPTMRTTKKNREIRGLRVCQDENCKAFLNRDVNASRNIGLQFKRLFEGKSPIRLMTAEDLEFHKHNLTLSTEAT